MVLYICSETTDICPSAPKWGSYMYLINVGGGLISRLPNLVSPTRFERGDARKGVIVANGVTENHV